MDRASLKSMVLNRVWLHIVIIALTGLICYSNTLDAPFQWDEATFIEGNPLVKDLSYFLDPSKAEGLELSHVLKNRHIGFLTFALNYKIHGLDVTGYHIVNISIHLINSLLVYLLVVLTFKTPFIIRHSTSSAQREGDRAPMIAFFTALFFISHPIQTEAVTYIFQRLASLVTMFYLLSMVCYIKCRLRQSAVSSQPPVVGKLDIVSASYYLASLISCILAMKTKENSFTLPLMIILYEFFFFDGQIKKRLLRLVPLLLTLLVIPLTLTGIDKPAGEIIGNFANVSRGFEGLSRSGYLFTQLRVIVTYIRLLFFPVNQNIDYDYPVFLSFFDQPVLLSFLFLFSLFCLGVYLFYRSRITHHALRLIAFGIFWFFIALSVESSVVPIPMFINEYRVYLPSVGAFMGVTSGISLVIDRLKDNRTRSAIMSAVILIIIALSFAAYARNRVWGSKISLWEDTAKKSQGKNDAHFNLGNAYFNNAMFDKAISEYLFALNSAPYSADIHNNLGLAYQSVNQTDKAMEQFDIALKLKPDYPEAHNNIGIIYMNNGMEDKAIDHYKKAIRSNPGYVQAHNNLATVYAANGETDKALEHLLIAVKLRPEYPEAHSNLGTVYADKGMTDQAMEQFQIALRLNPNSAQTHYNISLLYLGAGLKGEAYRELALALQISPDYEKARALLENMSK